MVLINGCNVHALFMEVLACVEIRESMERQRFPTKRGTFDDLSREYCVLEHTREFKDDLDIVGAWLADSGIDFGYYLDNGIVNRRWDA